MTRSYDDQAQGRKALLVRLSLWLFRVRWNWRSFIARFGRPIFAGAIAEDPCASSLGCWLHCFWHMRRPRKPKTTKTIRRGLFELSYPTRLVACLTLPPDLSGRN